MNVLAMILAGGEGPGLGVLTALRSEAALPFAGKYRCIDFTLSNCVNSGIYRVAVLTQYEPRSLNEHIGNGRPWDLDRGRGGIRLLQPYQSRRGESGAWQGGTADAVRFNLDILMNKSIDQVLVLAGDHIYKMDYTPLLQRHAASGADLTLAVRSVSPHDAHRFGMVGVEGDNRVVSFEEKPERTRSTLASMGVYVFERALLVEWLTGVGRTQHDFGREVIPSLVERRRVGAYAYQGYWTDVGTIQAYWEANTALLAENPALDLYDPDWVIHTRSEERPAARIGAEARVEGNLLCDGCQIEGTVLRSVIAPGVYVARGAVVRDAIVMNATVIGEGAVLEQVVVDKYVSVGPGARLGGGDDNTPNRSAPERLSAGLTVIGRNTRIPAGLNVGRNVEIAPDLTESAFPEGRVESGATIGEEARAAQGADREFHVSRQARDQYQFDSALFSLTGNAVFANFRAARVFALKMNARRDLASFPEQTVRAGQLNALGLIDEILHYVVGLYRVQVDPDVLREALEFLYSQLGREAVDQALRRFADEFPTVAVYRGETGVDAYLEGETNGVPNRQVVLEEMLMLWLSNVNPAAAPLRELLDDRNLQQDTAYSKIIAGLDQFLDGRPKFGPDRQQLVEMLRSPAIAVPHSLTGQLEYILERWGFLVGKYLYRVLGGLDLLKEEEKLIFLGPGPAVAPVYDRRALEAEPERYSADRDWMPNVVMIAKTSYVWLDQLSKKYRRAITRLDQIPDEELDQLARWGFTGLWFIGIWERSRASQRIKQMMGNPDAVASAYSLLDYRIADDLGGEAAYANLRERAWQRGLRLASDMVPNHMGIDSQWVMEHPDWFVELDYSPFPSYSFNGPDLGEDARVGIFLEDHYYTRSDAAVVFKRLDKWTGSEKYVYHGNDGTSYPWNDTAQLNYLKGEVREAVIQTILHVARKFPIIRFDAAMTLTKKHYQRLWFPEPGTGGAIPSRAEHGLTREQFDALMPEEFWREVVDRVAAEAPDTLLLAEAFWLLEGYFVRTLGMHRVYNSAFMHMLRDEDNAKYRSVIKNTIEFDPEILKRYVNFMNNPDERTAVDQFGREDKYFGVSTLLATMPGLPMFGHGQIEGLAERYGMDFRHPLWDEQPDSYLIQRHEREIFPLLHRRRLFAEVENFLLYDFFTTEGTVNEDVFAFSNRSGQERALVIYHNKFAQVRGWIRTSAAYLEKRGEGRALAQKSLGEGLALLGGEDYYSIFRDQSSGLEYIRSSQELGEKGLYVELGAYKYHVFLDWREVQDNASRHYAQLCAYLNGRGVPSIQDALREIFLQPVQAPFKELVNADMFRRLMEARAPRPSAREWPTPPGTGLPGDNALLDEVEQKYLRLLREAGHLSGGAGDLAALAREVRLEFEALLHLPAAPSAEYAEAVEYFQSGPGGGALWYALFGWLFVHALGKVVAAEDYPEQSRTWIDEWLLGKTLAGALQESGMDEGSAWRTVGLVKILTGHQRWFEPEPRSAYRLLEGWLGDDQVQGLLHVNRYQGILWFNQESFEQLLFSTLLAAVVEIRADTSRTAQQVGRDLSMCHETIALLQQAERASKYQVQKLLAAARTEPAAAAGGA